MLSILARPSSASGSAHKLHKLAPDWHQLSAGQANLAVEDLVQARLKGGVRAVESSPCLARVGHAAAEGLCLLLVPQPVHLEVAQAPQVLGQQDQPRLVWQTRLYAGREVLVRWLEVIARLKAKEGAHDLCNLLSEALAHLPRCPLQVVAEHAGEQRAAHERRLERGRVAHLLLRKHQRHVQAAQDAGLPLHSAEVVVWAL
mmetsp:Transcript_14334/g.36615  ORF Transcript_14334/g.36615 Transcript_14334/m.36615 type:complete len:201 (-) Transcript_14334:2117-2719(-)